MGFIVFFIIVYKIFMIGLILFSKDGEKISQHFQDQKPVIDYNQVQTMRYINDVVGIKVKKDD